MPRRLPFLPSSTCAQTWRVRHAVRFERGGELGGGPAGVDVRAQVDEPVEDGDRPQLLVAAHRGGEVVEQRVARAGFAAGGLAGGVAGQAVLGQAQGAGAVGDLVRGRAVEVEAPHDLRVIRGADEVADALVRAVKVVARMPAL